MNPNLHPVHPIVIPTPFPVGSVNVYFLDGCTPALVDAGPETADARGALVEGLAALKRSVSDIRRLVVTHAHPDHSGLAAWVIAESGAELVGHHFSVARLAGERASDTSRDSALADILLAAGVPPSELLAMRQDFVQAAHFSRPVKVDQAVEDGDTLQLGDGTWQVLYTPGHTREHICLYHRQGGHLLSGDHLLREISSNPIVEAPQAGEHERPRSLVAYISALRRVAGLDVSVAWPGHGHPIEQVRELIARRIAFHQRRADQIAGCLHGGPLTAYQISESLFPGLQGVQLFLGVSEVIGHLDILEDAGRVLVLRQGILKYASVDN